MTHHVAAFYKFVTIPDGAGLRNHLQAVCARLGIVGTILIAPEGMNGTIAGLDVAVGAFMAGLRADPLFTDLDVKHSVAGTQPFQRLKVKLKREIVTFGVPEANPALRVGTYVEAADWNELISDPDIVLIDTRNGYEVGVGTFAGALDPKTGAFGEFPAFAAASLDPTTTKKIAMFCTGGIRCEKASSYLLGLGFENVYHLKGGILKYLEVVPPEQSLWQGECFVFDERVALQHGLTEGSCALCPDCGDPVPDGAACAECR